MGIEMGSTATGGAATLDLEELLSTRLLVQGNSGSGKSHLLRRLLEQTAPWVQQVIIDPEAGVYPMVGPGQAYDEMITGDYIEGREPPKPPHEPGASEMF